MKITTVLLDAGGVILDESEHEKVLADVITNTIKEVKPEYTKDQYYLDIEEAVQHFNPKTYRYVIWKYTRPDIVAYNELYSRSMEVWKEQQPPLKLYDRFAKEAKEISQHFNIGMAGQYRNAILSFLEKEDVLKYIKYPFTQDDFEITKPDPRYFEQMIQRIGVSTEECIMVGDRIDNDIVPAKQLGMKTILIRVGLHKDQQPRLPIEQPDIELESISGLAAAIEELGRIAEL